MAKGAYRVLQDDPTPFSREGGPVGVLLLHGFGGTPREMQPLGDYLHECGFTVDAPLLPGHGGTLEEINQVKWQAWTAAARRAYDHLSARCEHCIVAGFSMGALLALWLAERATGLSGIALYSPALKVAFWSLNLTPLLRYVVKSIDLNQESDLHNPDAERWLGGYGRYSIPAAAEVLALQRDVRRNLARVRVPALVVYSTGDRSIHPDSGPETIRLLSQRVPVEALVLHHSGHAVVVDLKWESVAETTRHFVERCTNAV